MIRSFSISFCSVSARVFSENLFETPEGMSVGLSYFKERGFQHETLKKFGVGYSFEKRDAFTTRALEDGHRKEFLTITGLSIQHDERIFDRFGGRVMFPIHSLSGQVLGFGGRILKTDVKTAKYLNSPESEIYHKSRILYGIYQARKSITYEDRCYLVEGYTDVMSVHEAGIENVVASSGTSLTQEQVRLIKRFTQNITILYDGDAAGIKASLRGIDLVLEEGMNVKIVLLPDGEDPDSYSKKISNEDFAKFLRQNETDFIRFKTQLLLTEANNDPMKKADLIRDIVKSIAVIPETITRTVYIKECSNVLEVSEPILYHEVNKLRQEKNFQDRNKYPGPEDLPNPPVIAPKPVQRVAMGFYSEKEVIRLLLKFGNNEFEKVAVKEEDELEVVITVADYIVREITDDELAFDDPVCSRIFSDFFFNWKHGLMTSDKQFVKHEDPAISSLSADLLADSHELSKIWSVKQTYVETEEMRLKDVVGDVVLKFKSDKINLKRKELMGLLEEAVKANDTGKVLQLQKRYSMLNLAMGEISKKLGGRIVL